MMAAPAALSSGFVHACGWHGRSAARRRRKRRWQGQGAGGTARQLQLEQPISSRCRIRDRKDQHNRRELACKGASWLGVLLAEKHGTARTTPPTRAAPVSCGAPLFLGLLSFVATRCQPVHPLLDLPRWHLQRSRGRPPPAPCAAAAMRAPTPLPLCTPRCCCEQAGSAVPGAGLGPHPAQLCHAGRGGPRPGRAAGQPRRRRGRQPAARPPPAVPHGRHQGKPGWVGACVCAWLELVLELSNAGGIGWLACALACARALAAGRRCRCARATADVDQAAARGARVPGPSLPVLPAVDPHQWWAAEGAGQGHEEQERRSCRQPGSRRPPELVPHRPVRTRAPSPTLPVPLPRRPPPAGNRVYAASVCRLLDPSSAYFGDRIIAQVGWG